MFSKSIKIKEYTSTSIQGKSTRSCPKKIVQSTNSHTDLKINFLKLSVAMVKANTTSSSIYCGSLVYDSILSALNLNGLMDHQASRVSLRDGFREKYRDFSKSSRTGELAQAINYVFAQEKLGYKFIFDYDEFLIANNIPAKTSGATPDYVMLGKSRSNLAVLESKGSSASNELPLTILRTKLQAAMDDQCQSGVRYLQNNRQRVSNSYVSLIELAEVSDLRESVIHFADPNYDEFDEIDYSKTVENYYSRWLSFIGLMDNTSAFEQQKFDVVEYEGNDFYVQKSLRIDRYLNLPIRFGISVKAVSLFRQGLFRELYRLEIEQLSLDKVEVFSDGTIALEVD
ncbi:hypothetical protein LG772_000203 [Vibrio parahaemolyticus]|nr:hypothetical protein [Vibrio parahaemolyticus]